MAYAPVGKLIYHLHHTQVVLNEVGTGQVFLFFSLLPLLLSMNQKSKGERCRGTHSLGFSIANYKLQTATPLKQYIIGDSPKPDESV